MRVLSILGCVALAAVVVAAQEKQERPGITNFTRVDAVVACGGATDVSALEGLEHDGFKTIINLRTAGERGVNLEENRAKAEALGLKYVHIPFSGASPDTAAVDRFLATIADTSNQPVYVHCASASRVGAMWMVKRVLQDGWTVDKAVAEAKVIGLRSAGLEQFAREYIASHQ